MPTVAKSSSKIAKLGDISTFGVSSAAIPYDTSDTSGSIPTFSATFSGATDPEFQIGETLTLKSPSVGTYSGEVVNVGKAKGSGLSTLSADSMLARLNSEIRAYPLSDYSGGIEYTIMPLYSLEYWTQQCGIFYSAVPGDVLFYQSLYGHFGAFVKNITRPVRSKRKNAVTGGNNGNMYMLADRVYTGLGRGYESYVDFPAPAYLPVLVPATTTGKLVIGLDVKLTWAGNSGYVTWEFYDAKGVQNRLRLTASADTGFSLQYSRSGADFTTLLTAAAPNQTLYSVFIGASTAAGVTTYSLKVIDSTGAVIADVSTDATTQFTGTQSLRKLSYWGALGGAGDELAVGNSFISTMDAMPVKRAADQKSLTVGYKGSAFMVGFSGNVWEHIKQFCSIYHLDVSYQNGKLVIGPRQRDITVGANLSELKTTVNKREQARNVEVVNQNHKATGVTPTVMWAADSVYQVAVGETQEFLVQTDHSILEVSNPVCVSGISPYPYKTGAGQYVVTGSDGYIVSPTFWRDQGGSITADTTENEGEIKVTLKGPDFSSSRAPYRISEGDAGRPALYITGQGVLADPKTLKVATGNGKAAKDVGVTIDSPFIGNAKLAYDAAARASATFASPEITVSIAEPLAYDEASKLGVYPAGKLVKQDGNVFRVVTADQGYSSLTGNASQHNTIYQLNRSIGEYSSTVVRTNFAIAQRIGTNWAYQLGTGEASVATQDATGAGPNGLNGFARRTITTAKTGGNSGYYRNELNATGVAGDKVTGSMYVRSSVAVSVAIATSCRVGTGGTGAGNLTSSIVTLTPNVWTRLSATATATADYGNVQVWAIMNGSAILPVGATFDATQMLIEKSPVLGDFFDGNSPRTTDNIYAWTGTANNSPSTQSALTGTVGQLNAYYNGKTIGQVNIKPLKKVN